MVNNEFVNINDIIASKKKYKYSINKFLEKYKIMGIYGIYLQNKLIYIGQSNNIGKRWVIHKTHITREPSKCRDYMGDNCPLYNFLRNYYQAGIDISFSILEIINDKSELNQKESEYIKKFNPICNVRY